MGERADVRSIDVLDEMRRALHKFAGESEQALTLAHSEVSRTKRWVEDDRLPYWNREVRKREDAVAKARLGVLNAEAMKKWGKVSTVDERKNLTRARQALDEARDKVKRCMHWSRQLERDAAMFSGGMQPLASLVEHDLPSAAHKLGRMGDVLEEYTRESADADASPSSSRQSGATTAGTTGSASAASAQATRSFIPRLRRRVVRGEARTEAPQAPASARPVIDHTLEEEGVDRVTLFAEDNELEIGKTKQVWLLAEHDAHASERAIALVRTTPADQLDSGWTALRLDTSDPDEAVFHRMTLARARDDDMVLGDVFRLPIGWGIIIKGGRVRCVFDDRDWVVWGSLEGLGEGAA